MPRLPRLFTFTLGRPGRQRPPSADTSTSAASRSRWRSKMARSVRLPTSSSPSSKNLTLTGRRLSVASQASTARDRDPERGFVVRGAARHDAAVDARSARRGACATARAGQAAARRNGHRRAASACPERLQPGAVAPPCGRRHRAIARCSRPIRSQARAQDLGGARDAVGIGGVGGDARGADEIEQLVQQPGTVLGDPGLHGHGTLLFAQSGVHRAAVGAAVKPAAAPVTPR